MKFTIYTANCTGKNSNTVYPNKTEIENADQLTEAVKRDHVCATYKGNRRSNDNFISSDCLVMDLDNVHTEDPDEFITAEKLDELFSDISYALIPSRNHMREKNGHPASPRYHIMFPISECTDINIYRGLKEQLLHKYPFFDDNAKDAARFLFGSDAGEVIWHEGWLNIDDELDVSYRYDGDAQENEDCGPAQEPEPYTGTIEQGSRNNHMSQYAARVLKRCGYTQKAYDLFIERSKKCNPPLPDEELATIWNSAVRFFKTKISKSEDYVDAAEYDDDFKVESLEPEDYSDIGEAKVLAREFEDELRYSDATGYLRYDGMRWVESEQAASGAMIDFLDLQLDEARDIRAGVNKELIAAGVPEPIALAGSKAVAKVIDPEHIKLLEKLIHAEKYMNFVMKHRDYKYIVSTANSAKSLLGVDVSDLDKDPFMLNTKTGTYDLHNGLNGCHEHRAADFITKVATCGPDQEGREIWEDALDVFFCNDKDLIEYVQLVVGLAAIGKVHQEHMIIAYGAGANGKSTFWNTLFRVLGDYAGKISADALTTSCRRNVKPEMAEMKGKRLIIASEMDEGVRLNTGVVKQLCATDDIYAEKKYKAPFSFKPSHTLVLYTNHLPRVGASDDGIWRRLIVIPFNATIAGSGDIKNYSDFLVENAGGAILSWIIEGAQKVINRDYHTPLPAVVQSAIEEYKGNNDWMQQFIDDCCDVDGEGLTERSGDLYQEYRSYCSRTGEYTRSTTDFYAEIDKRGFRRKKTKTGVIVYGIKLKIEQDFLD